MLSKVGPIVAGGELEGTSLLYGLLKRLIKGEWLPNGQHDVYLHPTAWAGWAGLLVTMINLLPIGQLDGGHIATAYFGNRYNAFARRLHRMLPLAAVGVFAWVFHSLRGETAALAKAAAGLPSRVEWDAAAALEIAAGAASPWLVWFTMILIIRRLSGTVDHPPVDEGAPLPASRRALFWLVVLVFVAIFMPVPLRMTMAAAGAP
jgi:membrane-associated protease RseP (regulator of RpoE activity)